ncbi:MAG: hypothetical protein SGBAC_012582, partial [Bacillariaceae sp.]
MSNYMGGQYKSAPHKVPTFPPGSDNGSIGSGSDFGLAMPQNYQVKTSPNRPTNRNDQRLVMLAKNPHATNGDVENVMQHQQQQALRKQQQQMQMQMQQQQQQQQMQQMQQPQRPQKPQQQQHVAFQSAPQTISPPPTIVRHSPNSPPRSQFQQGGFTEPWEEAPAPSKSVFGKLVSKIKPDGPKDDESRDNSYTNKSLASEKTRKVSNVDEKAREKRLKEELKKQKKQEAAAAAGEG